ncbi:MAG: ABC transporter ATP-binding protein [Telmatospirillum sp.]|nr:ABC transporter ATP-binding protein [Telmatospirillum sp.]
MAEPLLSVRNLTTEFATERGPALAVDNVDFDVGSGEVVGMIGESGSGKSVSALSILGLLPTPPARVRAGTAFFEGQDLLRLRASELRRIRGRRIGMIFQEPMTSLNPVFQIGDQIGETLRVHEKLGREAARRRAVELLDRVGIPSAAKRLDDYPHHLSGGMRQRVMIAIALACNPRLLIADEPTTALDVTVQAQILELLRALQRDSGMAILMITHNMGVIAEFADRVVVMYAGRVAETAPVERLFDHPRHPYSQGLLDATPVLERVERRLRTIPGSLPTPTGIDPGCRFAPRCELAQDECSRARPVPVAIAPGHAAACFRTDASAQWRLA